MNLFHLVEILPWTQVELIHSIQSSAINKTIFYSDSYWRCWITHLAGTDHHPVGTCKMGPIEMDPMAVVDPQLKVRNIQGLRVADGSIIPTIPSGNINIPIIMIGEKLADIIKKDYLN
jgi:choline dehydrogenase-like flavoprotein